MPFCPKCGKETPADAKFCTNCGATLEPTPVPPPPASSGYAPPSPLADLVRGSRIVAGIVDYIIMFVLVIIIGIVVGILSNSLIAPWGMTGPGMMRAFGAAGWMTRIWGTIGLMWLLWLVYFTYFEGTSGQTIGKKFTHIKVIKENGSKCDFGSALVRNILRIIDHLPFLYILGIILIVVTEKKQRLGDMLAKTIVVKA
jgi:uncharacterized RDD family membrane protein YckC